MKVVEINPGQTFEDIVTGSGTMKDERGVEMTAGQALKFAVANELKSDQEGDHGTIVERRIKHITFLNDLHTAIKTHTLIQFTEEEAKYIEGRVAQTFSTLISGPLIQMLRKIRHVDPEPVVVKPVTPTVDRIPPPPVEVQESKK